MKKVIKKILKKYEILTSENRVLPKFIILGAQKAGTTSLDAYLRQHPQIMMSSTKEIHFFDLNYSKQLKWYKSFFPKKKNLKQNQICGEASPYYLVHPLVPNRIKKTMPNDIKMIIMLRDPIDRAISHYFHEVRRGRETLTIMEAFKQENKRTSNELKKILENKNYNSRNHQSYSYIERGLYLKQIQRYYELFNKNQVLILSSEELFKNPKKSMHKVYRFLEINDNNDINYTPKNVGNDKKNVNSNVIKYLKSCFINENQKLFKYLEKTYDWK